MEIRRSPSFMITKSSCSLIRIRTKMSGTFLQRIQDDVLRILLFGSQYRCHFHLLSGVKEVAVLGKPGDLE